MSKYTINPAITQGVSHIIGSVEVGKLADLVVWEPARFGTKPALVLKSGFIASAQMVGVPCDLLSFLLEWHALTITRYRATQTDRKYINTHCPRGAAHMPCQ